MRLFISFDLEGIAAASSPSQMMPNGYDWQRFRELATNEVCRVVEACKESGATSVVIADGHGTAQNLLIEKLPSEVQLVTGWPRPLLQMQGIEAGEYKAALFIGYHASVSYLKGSLAHTFFTSAFHDIRLNGESVSEFDLNALLATYYGVPIAFASGDDGFVEQVRNKYPSIVACSTKQSFGMYSIRTNALDAVHGEMSAKIRNSLNSLDRNHVNVELPSIYGLEIEFKNRLAAEVASYSGFCVRTSANSCLFELQDPISLMKLISFLIFYSPTGQIPF